MSTIRITDEHKQLWEQLTLLDFDAGAIEEGFSARLAKEQGWSQRFTVRAILEYKAFIMLCMISPQEVTPSEVVDEVWHLHLLYTRSYWEEMCDGILGRSLHHAPSRGGATEDKRFATQYESTLALYEAIFGKEAPEDIWPRPKQRKFLGIFKRSRKSEPLSVSYASSSSRANDDSFAAGILPYYLMMPAMDSGSHRDEASNSSSPSGSGASCGGASCGAPSCGNSGGASCSSGSSCGGGGCGGGGCGGS